MAYRDDEDNLRARVARLEDRAAQADALQDENRELRRRLEGSQATPPVAHAPPVYQVPLEPLVVMPPNPMRPPNQRYEPPGWQARVPQVVKPAQSGLAVIAIVALLAAVLLAVGGPFVAPRAVAPLLCPAGYARSYQRVTMHSVNGVVSNDVALMCVTSSGDVAVDDVKLFGLWAGAGLICFLSCVAAIALADRRVRQRQEPAKTARAR